MPQRRDATEQIVKTLFDEWQTTPDTLWQSIYRLLLDYVHDVPRITDANRLRKGVWQQRAKQVEQILAQALKCSPNGVKAQVDILMRNHYATDVQRMNPVGNAFACSIVYAGRKFGNSVYRWAMEVPVKDVFPILNEAEIERLNRKALDIVIFKNDVVFAVISSKWGTRHDRLRDQHEEADFYKHHLPTLKFYVATNEFDSGRLQKLLRYPAIDGVFHVHNNLVNIVYSSLPELVNLKDFTDLFLLFR